MSRRLDDLSDRFRPMAVNLLIECPDDGGVRDSVLSSNVGHASAETLSLFDLTCRLSGDLVSRTMALLSHHVRHILLLCAEKQVIWSHAGRRIASVQHAHPSWNIAVVDDPRSTVRVYLSAIVLGANRHVAVSVGGTASNPQPACVCLANVSPEPHVNRKSWAASVPARIAAVGSSILHLQLRRNNHERLAAVPALTLDSVVWRHGCFRWRYV